jgi:hypothetical protein
MMWWAEEQWAAEAFHDLRAAASHDLSCSCTQCEHWGPLVMSQAGWSLSVMKLLLLVHRQQYVL